LTEGFAFLPVAARWHNRRSELGGSCHAGTRLDAGTFHAFHTLWISEIMKALNAGLLPKGYYALAEQAATRMQTDMLTLRVNPPRGKPGP
jgi:hypothetical protein